jgi:hypothetical protein
MDAGTRTGRAWTAAALALVGGGAVLAVLAALSAAPRPTEGETRL